MDAAGWVSVIVASGGLLVGTIGAVFAGLIALRQLPALGVARAETEALRIANDVLTRELHTLLHPPGSHPAQT